MVVYRKDAVRAAYMEHGEEAARKLGLDSGLRPVTLRTWFSTWRNTKKQRDYRARHLGPNGSRHRLIVDLEGAAMLKLRRLARHRDITIKAVVEELVAAADSEVRHRMTEAERRRYVRKED